ncbi:hypothetical protein CR513_38237, partial [Mucuna pruriens]
MLDKGNSNTGFAMYCKRSGHTKDICYKRYGKEKVLERMGGNKGSTKMWVNQTTSNKENEVEHPSTSQLDQDIQAFSKEEMDWLRALLNSTSKPLGSCGLTMNGKSSFNISGSVPQSIWILDSGATDHMTPFPSHFTSYLKVPKRQLITIANGDHVPIVGFDNIQLHSSLSLHNVLHVPKLANNLISINRLIQDWNCAVTFFRSHCVIQELTMGRTIGVAKDQGGLCYLQHTKIGNNTNKEELPSSQQATLETWAASQIWLYHKCLGHPPFGLLKTMFPHLFIKESVESFIINFSKHHHAIFSPSNNKSLEPFDLTHSDVWGPTSNSISGAKWFISFIDDCTHVTWIFLLKHKYEVCQIFVDFFHLVKNQFNKSIKRLRSDNGTEFVNLEFSKFLKDNGVVHELTCVNTSQQKGVAERKSHHFLEVARALLFQMSVPNVYWGKAILTTTYLINRLPTQVLNGISPIKHMLSFFPSSPLMLSLRSRVFGCVAFVHSHNPHCGKLDPKAMKCVFIGYPSNKKGFKCYHPLSHRFFVSMDVTFHETQSFFGESYLQVESVIESLPFPTQDVQVQVQEVTFTQDVQVQVQEVTPTQDVQVQEVTPTQDVQVQEVTKPTLVPEQVQMSELDVSIPDNSIEEQVQLFELEVSIPDNSIEDVTDDMPIALRKGKRSCVKYPISQFVRTNHLSVQHQ